MSALLVITGALALCLTQVDAGAAKVRLDDSPHNFFGVGGHSSLADTDLCQLCHVPSPLVNARHRAPRWAPQLGSRNTALDVRADPNGPPLAMRWAGSTLRCLSCHDETVSSIGVTFRPASGSLVDDAVSGDVRRHDGTGGPALAVPQWWSGEVMGNHPVSVPYPVGGAEYRDFTARATPLDPRQWVEDPRLNGLKLVADTSGFDVLRGTAGVECVSCHDPHGTANGYFLRLPKERSALCLGCHRK